MFRRILAVLCIAGLWMPADAQTGADSLRSEVRRLSEEVRQLRMQIDSLQSQSQESDASSETNQLEETIDRRIRELESKVDAATRASAPTVLNPRTTAFINFAARSDSKAAYDQADPAKEISNRPFLRTVELDLRNAVDPYAEAVTIISLENQAGKEFAIDAEEAYGLIKRLPILESAPMGLKLKIGKFRAPFGVNNMIHMHDLPWTTRPLLVSRYLGTEHGNFFESGFNPTGIDFNVFLPDPIPGTTLEGNLDFVRAGDMALSSPSPGSQPAYVGHVNLSKDWSNEHLLYLGASTYQETGPRSVQLYGVDLTYRWAPSEMREYHSFVAGGEAFFARRTDVDSTGKTLTPWGWFGYLQYQASYPLYLGARYDWLQEPFQPENVTRAAAAYLSYYTTEFLRFRLGFEHRWSDLPSEDNLNTGILEVNLVFGSHPTEPYWVNR